MKQSLDFIVIGAQKSGTTALFEYLRHHPELYLPSGKEAPFFSHDSEWNEGWGEYVRRNFALAPDAAHWGTVTPHYMYGSLYQATPGSLAAVSRPERLVPERIASHSPEARLVAIVRDPVERAYSHFRMERFREAEQRTFDAAIGDLLDPRQLEQSRRQPTETTAYVTNGEYGRILSPYFELFGKERILVCFARDLAETPTTTFASVLQFLDVADDFQPSNLGERYRVAGSRRRLRRLNLDSAERRVASSSHLRSAWHALPGGYRVVEPNSETPSKRVEKELRAHYPPDREYLQLLIEREPDW